MKVQVDQLPKLYQGWYGHLSLGDGHLIAQDINIPQVH